MGIYFSDAQQTRAAHLINFASLKYQTRRTLSGSVSNQEMLLCDFGDYNKQESGSVLAFEWGVIIRGGRGENFLLKRWWSVVLAGSPVRKRHVPLTVGLYLT